MINKLININEPYRVWNGWGGCERTPGMWTLEPSGRQEVWALPLLYFLSGCTAALQEGPGGREDGAFGCPRWRPSSPGPLRGCPWFPWLPWGLQHLSNQQFCLLHASRAAATVLGQLFGAELAGKQLICKACDALPLLQLPPFCLPQKGHISLIPHENAGRELCHEQAIERVTVSVQACSEAPQEVPHIQTNHQIIPAAEHGSCPGRAHSRAAVSVHIEECGGCHSSRLVPVHQACGHGQQPLTLMWGEHGHEDLPVLIPHIGDPGCGASGCSCQFFDHLLLKNRRFNKLQTCLTSTKDQMCKYSCI